MPIWTIAGKDLRLLLRDVRALLILLALPLFFVLVLGVTLGEGFGKKDALRVAVVNLDRGIPRHFDRPAMTREAAAWLAAGPDPVAGPHRALAASCLACADHQTWFPHVSWSEMLLRDLGETAGIEVELIPTVEEARELVRNGRRAAVLVLGPRFSRRVERCSFLASGSGTLFAQTAGFPAAVNPIGLALAGLHQETQDALPLDLFDGVNPFYRDGVNLAVLDVTVLKDETQVTGSAVIDQVAQGSLLRVIMPWMIGRAFEKLGDPQFLALLGREPELPAMVRTFLTSPFVSTQQRRALGTGLQGAVQNLFPRYNLTAKTWAALTKEREHTGTSGAGRQQYRAEGWLRRGTARYQLLVPAYLVTFAFALILTVGWVFVGERRQGTMRRLMAAPITRGQILLGKLLPWLLVSLLQGLLLLLAGRVLFGMSWGPEPYWLVPLVAATSLAAMGLALLVAALARTEMQVAIYGTLLVLGLGALASGMTGDRSLMPEVMQRISLVTPHAWALDAYRQLLFSAQPNLALVAQACVILAVFGVGFLALAWWFLKLEA